MAVTVRRGWAWIAVLAGLLMPSPAVGAPTAQPQYPREPGTVDTLAGPGFCAGGSGIDSMSRSVRSLAIRSVAEDPVLVETGPPGRSVLAEVAFGGYFPIVTRPTVVYGAELPGQRRTMRPDEVLVPGMVAAGSGLPAAVVATAREVLSAPLNGDGAFRVSGNDADPPASTGDRGLLAGARFTAIKSLTGDEAGNLFVTDELDAAAATVRVRFLNRSENPITFYSGTSGQVTVAPGTIDTIAGAAGPANAGDGGPALQATFAGETPAMTMAGRRLYISLFSTPAGPQPEARIRMINLGGEPISAHGLTVAPGSVATVAGGGPAGYSGSGGPALSAALSHVPGMSADEAGNLYLADQDNHRVRMVDPRGTILNVAGAGGAGPGAGGFNGNDRAAETAQLNRPFDVKVGFQGRLYVSDDFNGQVRYIDGAGVIHVAGGNGIAMSAQCQGEPPPGAPAGLRRGEPASVAAAEGGAAYVVVSGVGDIKRVDTSGAVTTVAGIGSGSCIPGTHCPLNGGDGGPATAARLQVPVVVQPRPGGGLYVLDRADHRIRFVNTETRPLLVHRAKVAPAHIVGVAGDGSIGNKGDGGKALAAQLSGATSLAADTKGNLFVAEPENHRVRRVGAAGRIVTYLGPGGELDPGTAGCCPSPSIVAADGAGNLYLYDRDAHRVFFLNRGSSAVTVHGQSAAPGAVVAVAGSGEAGFGGDRGPALNAAFVSPAAMVVDRSGNLYVADAGEHTVRRIDTAGIITTAIGTGKDGFNGDGLKGPLTALRGPSGVAVDACGNLLVADSGNDRVRRLNLGKPCLAAALPVDNEGREQWPLVRLGLGLLLLAALVIVFWRLRSRRQPG